MLAKRCLNGVEILSLELNKLKEALKEITSRIRQGHSQVKQIFLFGSFTRKDFTPYSDVDIAIIVNKADENFLKRQDEFIDYFKEFPFDINVVIYTVGEFEKMSREGNSFIREVLKGERL